MEFKSRKPIGVMPVLIDAATRQAEVIDVNVLAEEAFVINHHNRNMLLAYVWGGYDSMGKFHRCHDLGASQVTISDDIDGERDIFRACARCPKGNPVRNYDEAFKQKVLLAHGQLARVINGAWNIDEIELEHKGQSVFTKEKRD